MIDYTFWKLLATEDVAKSEELLYFLLFDEIPDFMDGL